MNEKLVTWAVMVPPLTVAPGTGSKIVCAALDLNSAAVAEAGTAAGSNGTVIVTGAVNVVP